ncbi:hypothetical protein [Enterococcus sp. DIV0240a]|uniref:hypothetical protein n=1 Tax=Enterococcus sp. DIV0240a TaxID=2774651 RepID=UPI003D286E13
MFDIKLPEFFMNDSIEHLFENDINDLFTFKNNDFFKSDALKGFIEVSDALETALLDFQAAEKHKVRYFNDLSEEHEKNNEELRDLNDQLVVQKIERQSFGEPLDDIYKGII